MSMQTRVDDYLAMRRSLGFKLHGEGRMLADFAARLDDAGQASITISAALAWATESQQAAPAHWRRRRRHESLPDGPAIKLDEHAIG